MSTKNTVHDLLYNANLCVNLAIEAANHIRKYMPDDDKLTEADRTAIFMLDRAIKCADGNYEQSPGYVR